MSSEKDQFKILSEILKAQQEQAQKAQEVQQEQINMLSQMMVKLLQGGGASAAPSTAAVDGFQVCLNRIQEFVHDPANGFTFDSWYKRNETIPVRGGTQNFGVVLVWVLVWIKNPANLLVWVGLRPANFGDNSVFKG